MKYLTALLFLVLAGTAMAFDDDATGAWFDPANDGHGFVVQSGDWGAAGWWFTYSPDGDQAWFVTGEPEPSPNNPDQGRYPLYFPLGQFPARNVSVGEPVGWIEPRRTLGGYRVRYWIDLWGPNCGGGVLPGPLPESCAGTVDLVRLTP